MKMILLKVEFTSDDRDILPSVPLHEQIDSVLKGLCIKKQSCNILKQNPYKKKKKRKRNKKIYLAQNLVPNNTHHTRTKPK